MCVGVQGDREKEVGLTVSPLMDRRHKGGITRSQVRLCSEFMKGPCCMQLTAPGCYATAPGCYATLSVAAIS